jgi:hypothetical protein
MALDKPTISTSIKTLLDAVVTETNAEDARDKFADDLADVIIAAIKSASVSVPGAGLTGYNDTPITGTSTTGTLS